MKNEISMYSEEEYVSRMQLKNIYTSQIADLMYDEILKYRKLFKYSLSFHARPFYITMNQTLYKKMLRIYEFNLCEVICKEGLMNEYEQFLNTYKQRNSKMNATMIAFLCSNEDLLIKTFVLSNFIKDSSFLYDFLLWNKRASWYSYIKNIHIQTDENGESLDLTYGLRSFLDSFYRLLKEEYDKNYVLSESKQNLNLKYPQIGEKNIDFYITHCVKNNRYTISVYQKYYKVSYECARLSMEKMYTYNWYRKIKIGKKHFYIPNLVIES